jgi:diguanylate cyclase (GGDEF)-like protein/PAS domain S-box-containing protein
MQKTIGTKILFSKFLVMLLPLFALVASAALWSISNNSLKRHQQEMTTRVTTFAKQMSVPLGSEAVRQNPSFQESYLSVFKADQAILCADVSDLKGTVVASWPSNIGCNGNEVLAQYSVPIKNTSNTLKIGVSNLEIIDLVSTQRTYLLLILGMALIIAAVASWFAFHIVVGKPLSEILQAIRQTQKTGKMTKILEPTRDELGLLATALNELQDEVESEAAQNQKAMARINHIYNETPAMMFAINEQGLIMSTSAFWLEVAGYSRDEIQNQEIASFVSESSLASLQQHMNFGVTTKLFHDVNIQFRRKNGTYIDVMLSATRDDHDEQKFYLCVMTDVSEFKSAQRSLQQIATTDHLTQLPNRKGLFDYIAKINQLPMQERDQKSFLFIDLDGFKAVNDTHGHEAGDALLKMVALRINSNTKAKDFVARLSGDEFVIVLQAIKQSSDVSAVAFRILEALAQTYVINGQEINIGASIGIADFNFGAETAEDVLNMADKAMYHSKNQGKNRITNFRPELALLEPNAQILH